MRDERLLAACLRGRRSAWQTLVSSCTPALAAVVRVAFQRTRRAFDQADVDDVLAETFVEVLKDDCRVLRGFQGRASLKSWLKVLAYRQALKHVDRQRPSASLDDSDLCLRPTSAGPSPFDGVVASELRGELADCLASLSERERMLIRLHLVEGRSYAEIAAATGVASGSVGPLLTRAKQRLGGLLARRGIRPDEGRTKE